jgi:hypothetical protein
MNTDRLIDILSVDTEPVSSGRFGRMLILAMVSSGAAAFGFMLATVGLRPDLQSAPHLEWLAIKLLFAMSVVGAGAPLLSGLMRPGSEDDTGWNLIFLPFFVAFAAALAMLLVGHPQEWGAMLRGATRVSSARCLLSIVFFAAIPLTAIICAVRKGAPTRLRLCGGIAGIVSGGIGAAAYAFSCRSDAIPFIAIWYGAAIVLCAVIGTQLGPRVLRW